MFLLDTDHVSIMMSQQQPGYGVLLVRMGAHPPSAFYRSIVSFHEQLLGAHTRIVQAKVPHGLLKGYEYLERIRADYEGTQVAVFDQAALTVFDGLVKQRVRIGTRDLRIASMALACNFTLLTRNTSDFSQVPGLAFDDWTK